MDEQVQPDVTLVVAPAEPSEPADQAADGEVADPVGAPSAGPAGRGVWRSVKRFVIAFTFGLLAVLTISAGALAAYESSNDGRILPGVRVGSVDLSGLGAAAAAARIREAYESFGEGTLLLTAAGTERTVPYRTLGRRVDVEAIVARALAVGRDGPMIERIAANIRMFVRSIEIDPLVTIEGAALRFEVTALAQAVAVDPVDAMVLPGETSFGLEPGTDGRTADIDSAFRAAETLLTDPAAPSSVRVAVPTSMVEPSVTNLEAGAARDAAERITADITLVDGDDSWTISAASIRGWITFAQSAEGGYGPVLAREGFEAGLGTVAADVSTAPIDATFLFGDGQEVVGVASATDGRALDIAATVDSLVRLAQQRVAGLIVSRVAITVDSVEPAFTTAEATEKAPLMKPISEWTTYFPIGIKNGGGVNIWIPAREIDGYVLLPGEWFDFWDAIGPVTRENGYKDGGAIINGKTEPQGALAGGICSTSTTLFNAALRAGLEMGARRNHYYYIDRYPLGLDATVFQSSSGSIQTMSFRNDTDNPILIRGTGWSVGSKGYVKFALWSVPTGRDVAFSKPIVMNVKPATDSTVFTTDLAPGVRERIEYPVDGKDVWVTRTVRDASGAVIHEETYYSHYARITGVLQIGTTATPIPTPIPTPTLTPTPAPA